jgi:predicted transcriptional regulator
MSKVKISAGSDGDRGADQLAVENWQLLARVLTAKRVELLRYARRHQWASVRALAKALGRDCRNVHSDVQTLIMAGLRDNSANGLRVDYDVIETKIAI